MTQSIHKDDTNGDSLDKIFGSSPQEIWWRKINRGTKHFDYLTTNSNVQFMIELEGIINNYWYNKDKAL